MDLCRLLKCVHTWYCRRSDFVLANRYSARARERERERVRVRVRVRVRSVGGSFCSGCL